MEKEKNTLTKLCSFYVSDWHLITMLFPYINGKINEEVDIATVLEKDLQNNVETLIQKLNLKNAEKILNINWKKSEAIIRSVKSVNKKQEIIILVNGSKEFIKKQNEKLERYMQTHYIQAEIKLINCFDVIELKNGINEILDEHDKILNTSGEKEITEVFVDYKNTKQYDDMKKVVNI